MSYYSQQLPGKSQKYFKNKHPSNFDLPSWHQSDSLVTPIPSWQSKLFYRRRRDQNYWWAIAGARNLSVEDKLESKLLISSCNPFGHCLSLAFTSSHTLLLAHITHCLRTTLFLLLMTFSVLQKSNVFDDLVFFVTSKTHVYRNGYPVIMWLQQHLLVIVDHLDFTSAPNLWITCKCVNACQKVKLPAQ